MLWVVLLWGFSSILFSIFMKTHPSGHLFGKKNELASVFYAFNCGFFIPLVLADGDKRYSRT